MRVINCWIKNNNSEQYIKDKILVPESYSDSDIDREVENHFIESSDITWFDSKEASNIAA